MTNMQIMAAVMVAAGTATAQTAFAPPSAATETAQNVPVVEKSEQGGWRVSGGLDYRFRFKTSLQMNAARYDAAHPPFTPPQMNLPSEAAVRAQIGMGTAADGRRDYGENGYVNPDDGALVLPDFTWDWAAGSASQYDAASGTVTFDSFYGVTESHIGARSASSVSDDADLAGVSLDIARELWRKGNFSLDVTLGGSYFPERSLLSARQSFAAGSYHSEVRKISDVYDASGWMGVPPSPLGGNGGSGAMLPDDPLRRVDSLVSEQDETFGGGAWADADLWLAEGRLCLMPKWQVFDRFSLLGNVGVAVEYVGISSHSGSWMSQNQTIDTRSSSFSDNEVIVQAILGLGARVAVTDRVGLSVMGEARLPRVTIDVEADPYEGEVELGTWSVGTQVDYCF